jgi:hypothetical protein
MIAVSVAADIATVLALVVLTFAHNRFMLFFSKICANVND